MRSVFFGVLLFALGCSAHAAVQSRAITYQVDGTEFTGYLYWDDTQDGQRPGVLVVHEWWGLNDYAKQRARMLAELGYVAFAVDMYGNNQVTDKPAQAREWMQEVTADVEGWRERALKGLEQLVRSGMVADGQLAAIGYCFGGATVLQISYANAPVKGVVSFHGALPAAPEEAKGKIGPQILVLHGQADTFVAPEVVTNFRNKLDEAGASWEMNTYGGVRHGFTNPDAAAFGIPNLVYDEVADRRSWARMQTFFDELFR
ncbi:MAG: dienelactone hydrolase family protein [Halieaceae bacterium]|jgi:dienelactone hydrolase|nr:dienelactone hydrolase family protein [Halieaceae bacterium]